MTDRERNRRITDLGTLKALAHPLRMQLYRGLTVARVATASHLADQVGEAVSLVSYHLRKLAEHGLIEEAEPQSADGRERWWRLASDGVSIRDEDFRDAPEKAAAHTAASRLFAEDRVDMYRRWLDERTHWGPEWNRSAESSESILRLTADDELDAAAPCKADTKRGRGRSARRGGRGRSRVHTYAFPFRADPSLGGGPGSDAASGTPPPPLHAVPVPYRAAAGFHVRFRASRGREAAGDHRHDETVQRTAPEPPAPEPAAHRDPNVLRWLTAYTASMVGDSVYYIALSWAAVQAGTPAQAGLVIRRARCRGPC